MHSDDIKLTRHISGKEKTCGKRKECDGASTYTAHWVDGIVMDDRCTVIWENGAGNLMQTYEI